MVPPAVASAPAGTSAPSLHDALPILRVEPPAAVLGVGVASSDRVVATLGWFCTTRVSLQGLVAVALRASDRKSTRLNSSHSQVSDAVSYLGAKRLVTVLVAGVWSTAL